MNTDLGKPTGRIMMRPAVVDHDQSSLVAASCVLVDNLGEETGAGRGFRARYVSASPTDSPAYFVRTSFSNSSRVFPRVSGTTVATSC